MKNALLIQVIAATLFLTIGGFSHAAIYSGTGPGESTIGTGGDYTSLNAACEAINSQPLNGGDWTFLILNDLNEPANPSIIQDELNGNRITLRPAPGTSSTVTFTTISAQQISFRTYGHLTIGAAIIRQPGSVNRVFKPTHNITIDGCNTPAGTERNLTFKHVAGAGARTLIAVQGNSDYFTIANCTLEASGVYDVGTNPQYTPTAGIDFVSNTPLMGKPEMADYPGVKNCFIRYLGGDAATGISMNTEQPIRPEDMVTSAPLISGNNIEGCARGLQILYVTDALISGNDISLSPAAPNFHSVLGIYTYAGTNSGVELSRNSITFPSVPDQTSWEGIAYACYRGGSLVKISNNAISGIRSLGEATTKTNLTRYGIRADVHRDSTATLTHNSIDMYQKVGDTNVVPYAAGIHLGAYPNSGDNARGLAILHNNIIRTSIRDGFAITSDLTSPTLKSDYNNLFVGPNSYYGTKAGMRFSTLAAWQVAMGSDINSISQDPYVAASSGFGTWIGPKETAQADLHFTAYPGPFYLAPALQDITHDLDGEPRNSTSVVMGADEMEHPNTAVDNWSIY